MIKFLKSLFTNKKVDMKKEADMKKHVGLAIAEIEAELGLTTTIHRSFYATKVQRALTDLYLVAAGSSLRIDNAPEYTEINHNNVADVRNRLTYIQTKINTELLENPLMKNNLFGAETERLIVAIDALNALNSLLFEKLKGLEGK